VGSLCTLELLIRRTTNSGWRNKTLLAAAGITFGAVSTFAMHFIFNNSLTLHHPDEWDLGTPALYLQYDAGYTVLSLVVSCIAMTVAFFIMGTTLQDWNFFRKSKQKEEYKKYKSQKSLRRHTINAGNLLSQTPKWSLMTSPTKNPFSDPDEAISKDKELEEMDFRLGRNAVKMELEKRNVNHDHERGSSIDTTEIRHMPSDASLIPKPIETIPMKALESPTNGFADFKFGSQQPVMEMVNKASPESPVSEEMEMPPKPGKKVRLVDKKGFTKIERFLGFDVVTKEDIIKIFFTGTIAGMGVAGMRILSLVPQLMRRLYWTTLDCWIPIYRV
jgi:hypothetical protein